MPPQGYITPDRNHPTLLPAYGYSDLPNSLASVVSTEPTVTPDEALGDASSTVAGCVAPCNLMGLLTSGLRVSSGPPKGETTPGNNPVWVVRDLLRPRSGLPNALTEGSRLNSGLVLTG